MVQKFLPLVKHGDKRVFILNGKVKGAIRRVPSKGSILSNISQGGSALKTKLNKKELYISKVIEKKLKKNNIFFAGIDLISNYLIGDINVTSPTGLPQYKNLTGINLAKNYWDEVKKLKPAIMISQAYIFDKDKKHVWTFASYDSEAAVFSDRNCFPRSIISKMEKIKL